MALFIGYATVHSGAEILWWIPLALWYGFVITGALAVLVGLAYMILLARKHLSPLHILDDIRCTYWPKEKQINVTLWFCDHCNSLELKLSCVAQFGNQIVVTDRVTLDGMYLGSTMCAKGRKRMVEFFKDNAEIVDASTATISVSIKPSGLWAKKRKNKEISVSIVEH